MSWIDRLNDVAKDFEDADVKGLRFTKVQGKITCVVTVLEDNTDLVTWELVDDGVSSDHWRKVVSRRFDEKMDKDEVVLLPNHKVRDVFIEVLSRTS